MKVLMVCLGNICRSPIAEGWLRKKAKEQKIPIQTDSAGTASYHVGNPPDSRMVRFANESGVDISDLRARQFVPNDFDSFDFIFAMDKSNRTNILKLARNENDEKKVHLYLNEVFPLEDREVPDPYYDGEKEFKHVIDLLEKATDKFLFNLKQTNQL